MLDSLTPPPTSVQTALDLALALCTSPFERKIIQAAKQSINASRSEDDYLMCEAADDHENIAAFHREQAAYWSDPIAAAERRSQD